MAVHFTEHPVTKRMQLKMLQWSWDGSLTVVESLLSNLTEFEDLPGRIPLTQGALQRHYPS